MKIVEVVAAIIQSDNKILVTQRGGGSFKGYWEFPGGKIEEGETAEEALVREIREELNIEIQIDSFYQTIEYDYPTFHLILHCYKCGMPLNQHLTLNVHNEAKFLPTEELSSLQWLPADYQIIDSLQSNI